MNQLTVPYEEIENRLAICCEFLLDRNRPIKNAYNSLMGKVGTKLMEYSKFEYWFRRFQNNQFDLGYDTSLDSKEISTVQNAGIIVKETSVKVQKNVRFQIDESREDTVSRIQNTIDPKESGFEKVPAVITGTEEPGEVVKRKKRNSKLNNQFNENVLPQFSKILINELSANLKTIEVYFARQFCMMKFDENRIRWDKNGNLWIISYEHTDKTCKTIDPEKSITDHLWFVLRNSNLELGSIKIELHGDNPDFLNFEPKNSRINFEKLETLLQSMLDTFDHQFETSILNCKGFNEDAFFSLLNLVKPETLCKIDFEISWKEKENYQKLKKIVETDQWKQAKTIYSRGVSPLNIDNLLHCEVSLLTYDRVTPENVRRVSEHLFNSVNTKCCTLYAGKEKIDIHRDINAIPNFLRSQNDGTEITRTHPILPQYKFRFEIRKSVKCVFLNGNENYIVVQNF